MNNHSEPRAFLGGRVTLHAGDCREVLRGMEDNSVDSVVTDPPYHLTTHKMTTPQPIQANYNGGKGNPYCRPQARSGFMGKQWDGGDIAFQTDLWAEVLRVLKPGGYAIIFGGTRTAHRMICAIEDAGFEIRDEILLDKDSETEYRAFEESLNDEQRRQFGKLFRERGTCRLSWQFGVGFPKSKNITASIDRCLCVLPLAASLQTTGAAGAILQPHMFRNGETENPNLQSLRGSLGTEDLQARSERENVLQEMREQVDFSSGKRSAIKTVSEGNGSLCCMREAKDGFSVLSERRSEPGLLQTLQRSPARSGMGETRIQRGCSSDYETGHVDGEESSMEGRCNSQEATRELQRSEVCEGSGMGVADGTQGSVHHGASTRNGSDVRISSDQNGSREPRGSQPSEQPSYESYAVSDERGSQTRGSWPICDRCGKPIIPEGLGTALKPAHEPICMARKTFERGLNGAQNVLKWGVGAINVGGCRVPTDDGYQDNAVTQGENTSLTSFGVGKKRRIFEPAHDGRWPANLIHDGSDEVLACFPETSSGDLKPYSEKHENETSFQFSRDKTYTSNRDSGYAARFFASFPQDAVQYVPNGKNDIYGDGMGGGGDKSPRGGSSANYFASFPQDAKRIFYTSKAGADDRLGSKHPTVKPLDLIQYLVRLVTPKNGVCLDLFAGTGTTGEACFREGFRAILIEREAEYIGDIERRMRLVMAGPNERAHAGMKARGRPRDDGPLFGGSAEQQRFRNVAAGFEGEERRKRESAGMTHRLSPC